MSELVKNQKFAVAVTQIRESNWSKPIFKQDDDDNSLVITTPGSLYDISEDAGTDLSTIVATEYEMDGEPTTATIKAWYDKSDQTDKLTVVTIGSVHSRQTFVEDEWHSYQMFYGGKSVVFRNYTKTLDIYKFNEYMHIECYYELWSGETHLGYHRLEYVVGFADQHSDYLFNF